MLSRRKAVLGLILTGPMLGACSSGSSMPSFSSIFGSSGAQAQASAAAPALPPNFECPEVSIRQGASTLTSSTNPAEPTAMNLRYQVTIGTTARECRLVGNNMLSIKVGMQGRVVLGPEGSPGSVDVPVRFAVMREGVDPKPIVTKLDRVAVTVPPGDSNVLFTHVAEGLEFPMPRGSEIDSYVVYIGFDALAAQDKRPQDKRLQGKPSARRKTS